MIGINRHTGRKIDGDAHLAQSINDILSTPKGTRVMRRDYGSDLPNIIDQPINGETMIDLFQTTAEALQLWEPRVTVERVQILRSTAGFVEIDLTFEGSDQTTPVEVSL